MIRSVRTTVLRPREPYALASSARGLDDGTRSFRNGVLDLRFAVDDTVVAARVRQRSDGVLEVATDAQAAAEEAAHEHLRFVLAPDLDLAPFLALAREDPLLRDLVPRRRGYRPLRTSTVAHALLHGVTGQLIQAREAMRIERAIIRELGAPLLPPTRADLGGLAPAAVERLGLAARRAAMLVRVARTVDLEGLHAHPTSAVVARLVRERDIGPWTAAVVCIHGLGRLDHGLVGDLGLVRILSALEGRRVEGAETAALLERYGPYAGLASMHLLAHPLAGVPVSESTSGAGRPRRLGGSPAAG
jgi:3-methyladenine DNA glycosylase/8-oxoguanine DNA glycosylase